MADAPEHAPANHRLPSFWCDAPRSWFTMAEAQFRLRNITGDNDKYLCLIAALPRDAYRTLWNQALYKNGTKGISFEENNTMLMLLSFRHP
jgi:hypothetical protein